MKIITGLRPSVVNFSSLGLIANDPFIVPANVTVMIDMDTPSLGATDISGTLIGDGNTRTLTTTGITIENGGWLKIGTLATPYTAGKVFTINLTGAYAPLVLTTINGFSTPTTTDASNRGIMRMPGGKLSLCGAPIAVPWTTLNASAAATATSLTLATAPGWSSGDSVVVDTTDFVEYQTPELFTLNVGTSGTTLTLPSGLTYAKYGVLQYPTDAGLSTTPGTFSTTKATVRVPTVLDERARVVNLSRNVVVTCPADTDWTNKGHGVAIMGMASSGTNQGVDVVDSIQIRRGGIRGAIGRYPLHFHMLSYNVSTGAFTSDATQSSFTNSVVWDSENRAYTIHGTCGTTVTGNVSYNVKGHAFFLEDGSERRNTLQDNTSIFTSAPTGEQAMPGSITSFTGNGTTTTVNWTSHGLYSGETLSVASASGGTGSFNVFRVPVTVVNANQFTYPSTGNGTGAGGTFTHGNNQIKVHDGSTSGYWITNADNTILNNYASYMTGNGAWISLANRAFGLSALVSVVPDAISDTTIDGFNCHSAGSVGLQHHQAVTDEAGNTGNTNKYPNGGSNTFTSKNHKLWKNSAGAYNNLTYSPLYTGWVIADNGQTDFFGSTNNGGISKDHLGIGVSLNNTNTQPSGAFYPRAFFTSYHGTVNFSDCSLFNYAYAAVKFSGPIDKGRGGGACGGEGGIDFYDSTGVDTTAGLNLNLRLFNSHPGPMVCPIHLDGRAIESSPGAQRHISWASVWYDTAGRFGPAGNFMLPLTTGTGLVDDYWLSGAASPADGPTTGTVACKTTSTQYFGAGVTDPGSWFVKYAGTPVNNSVTGFNANDSGGNPITVTRQDPSLGTTIGTPFTIRRGDTSWSTAWFRTFSMQAGGRFQLRFMESPLCSMSIGSPCTVTYENGCNHGLTAGRKIRFTGTVPTGVSLGTDYFVIATGLTGTTFRFSATSGGSAINTSGSASGTGYTWEVDPPDSTVGFDLYIPTAATLQGQYVLLGIPWANAATPRVCFGGALSNETDGTLLVNDFALGRNTFASAADVTNGKAIIASSGANLAAALADTTGATFWQDTTNNVVWVRFTNRNSTGSAALTGIGMNFSVTKYTVVVKV